MFSKPVDTVKCLVAYKIA